MSTIIFNGLLIVSIIAVAAPILAASSRRVRVPSPVVEIVAGVLVGPSVLGWVKIDQPINALALLGLAFLLFLAGLEIDLRGMTLHQLGAPAAGFAVSLMLGTLAGVALHAIGWVRDPLFLAITLSASSLGLIAPILADANLTETVVGRLAIMGATAGEFGAITLLTIFFSEAHGGTVGNVIAFAIFCVAVAVVGVTLGGAGRNLRLDTFLTKLQDTTAEIRVRIAVALLIGLVVLAAKVGLQTILGAFLAGVVLNLVDRDTTSHPEFHSKLRALGYGFMIPVFFVSSGIQLDLRALTSSPSAMARIPLFLLALLIVRGAPAVLYVRAIGTRGAISTGILQATSLPVIVTAASIGVALRVVTPRTAAALVAAGLLSVLIFPVLALGVIRADTRLTRKGV
jgi:Kef-type K+ transport system membrane component KefB